MQLKLGDEVPSNTQLYIGLDPGRLYRLTIVAPSWCVPSCMMQVKGRPLVVSLPKPPAWLMRPFRRAPDWVKDADPGPVWWGVYAGASAC